MRRRLVDCAAQYDTRSLFSLPLAISASFRSFMHLACDPDLRRVDARDERNTFPQQPHVLAVAFHRVAVDDGQRCADNQSNYH